MSDALRELLRRQDALDSPERFREYMAESGHLDFMFEPALHHRVMMEHFQWWLDTPGAKLIIEMPFGSAKTTYSSIQLPLLIWARYPTSSVLCSANTQDFVESLARRRRDAVETKQYRTLSGAQLRKDMQGVKEFGNDKGGIMRAVGVDASCTGFRSDYNICDDPHVSFEQLESRKYRDQVYQWYTAIYRSRLVPGGRELICTTRYSDDDLPGRLMRNEGLLEDGGDWRRLRIPELSEGDSDPLGRPEGERLWPEYLDPNRLKIRERDPIVWLGAYMQKPPSESGSWLGEENLPIVDRAPEGLNRFSAMDLALSVGKGDYSVIGNCGICPKGDLYITDIWRKRVSVDETAKALADSCRDFQPTEVLLDNDNAQKVFKTYAVDEFKRRGIFVPLQEMPTMGQDKETRAAAFRGFARQGRVKLVRGPWNAALIDEVLGFPDTCPNDDQIDILSLMGRRMAFLGAGKAPEGPKEPVPVQGALQQIAGETFTTHTMDDMWSDYDDDRLNAALSSHRI